MAFAPTSLFCKTLTAVALLGSTLAATSSANAALIDEIRITSSNNDYIQIGEVQAFDGSANNVALGGAASSSGQYDTTHGPEKAIDGSTNQDFYAPTGIFHSASGTDFLDIQLNGIFDVGSVTIFGRSDCCQSRNVFDVSFFNQGGLVFAQPGVDATSFDTSYTATFLLPAAASDPAVVPEPTSIALLGLGLLGFAASRRKSAK